MPMFKVDEIDNRVLAHINPKDYFLVEVGNEELQFHGEYALVHRIDMSYKGKPDQAGGVKIFLDKEEANKLRGMFGEYSPYD